MGPDASDWLPAVVMSFHCTSATWRMTCSHGVSRAAVTAIKTQPSVKLALIVHKVKTILLSNVTRSPYSATRFTCLTWWEESAPRGHRVHHCHAVNLFLTDKTFFTSPTLTVKKKHISEASALQITSLNN